jgi:hypothetical protein
MFRGGGWVERRAGQRPQIPDGMFLRRRDVPDFSPSPKKRPLNRVFAREIHRVTELAAAFEIGNERD